MGAKEIQISLMVNEKQFARLEKLLQGRRNFECQGQKPWENLTIEGLLQMIMEPGSRNWINDRIWAEEYVQENNPLFCTAERSTDTDD